MKKNKDLRLVTVNGMGIEELSKSDYGLAAVLGPFIDFLRGEEEDRDADITGAAEG